MLVVPKGWGHELWIINTDKYCGKQLTVLPGKRCSLHYHEIKDEVFYVIDGELCVEYCPNEKLLKDILLDPSTMGLFSRTVVLKKGDSLRIQPRMPHSFTSNTNHPCTFIEFSTHHSDEDSYRIVKGD